MRHSLISILQILSHALMLAFHFLTGTGKKDLEDFTVDITKLSWINALIQIELKDAKHFISQKKKKSPSEKVSFRHCFLIVGSFLVSLWKQCQCSLSKVHLVLPYFPYVLTLFNWRSRVAQCRLPRNAMKSSFLEVFRAQLGYATVLVLAKDLFWPRGWRPPEVPFYHLSYFWINIFMPSSKTKFRSCLIWR